MPEAQSMSYSYIGNSGGKVPGGGDNVYGAIGGNQSNGSRELDFINMFGASHSETSAFNWYMMPSSTTFHTLMQLYHSGELWVSGVLNAVGGVTTTTLTVSRHSQLADVSTNALTVSGNLTVTGTIAGGLPGTMEVLYYHLQGNASTVYETMALQQNITNTTNYVVMPSIYYGFIGSGALNEIVWTTRTSNSFSWTLTKSSSNNVSIYIVFLVVYDVSGSNFPSNY